MALNLTKFKSDLKAALLKAQAKNQKDNVDIDTAMGNLADEIATEVDKYIKTATISTNVSTTVTGTCVTPQGGGTIQGTGSGSGSGSLS